MRKIAASHVTGDAGEVLEQKFANIALASSGDTALVAAVVGKKIRVLSLFLVAAGDVDVYFESAGGTAIAGDGTNGMDLAANTGFALNFNPGGWFETVAGEALNINLGAAIRVAGSLKYAEVA